MACAVDPRGTPEDLLLAAERRRCFRTVCGRLLPGPTAARDTRVLELALLGGWSSLEIARGLGGRLAASTVDTLVYRLRRRLAASGIAVPKRDGRSRRSDRSHRLDRSDRSGAAAAADAAARRGLAGR